MIVRRVSMRSTQKSSFGGLARYITDTQGKTQRVGEVQYSNLLNSDLTWALHEVENTQARNVRAKGDKTYHLLISFAPGEVPRAEIMRDIELQLCSSLGYSDHQRISAVHRDTDCLHIHVAISKIHPTRHTMHEPYYDMPALGKVAEELERKYGLQQLDHSRRRLGSEGRASDMERHSGIQSLKGWIQSECLDQFCAAATWEQLHSAMHEYGLELVLRGNGLAMRDGTGRAVKASTVARELSKPQLEARLGTFTPALITSGAASRRRYEPRPKATTVDTSALFEAYKAEQSLIAATRASVLLDLRSSFAQQVEAAKTTGRFQRAAIKLLGDSAGNKRLLYAMASKSLKDAIEKARRERVFAREQLTEKHARKAWADWLRHRAGEGDAAALAALRARSAPNTVPVNALVAVGDLSGFHEDAVRDSVTKTGTVIFRAAGGSAIRDNGQRIEVASDATSAAVVQALRMASSRSGGRIRLTGADAFQEKAVRAAAAAGLAVTFANATLEGRRIAYVDFLQKRKQGSAVHPTDLAVTRPTNQPTTSSSLEVDGRGAKSTGQTKRAKPGIRPVGSRPPSPTPHQLRYLSDVQVLRLSDEPIERQISSQARSETTTQTATRAPESLKALEPSATPKTLNRAVAAFLAECEASRVEGVAMPAYTEYTGAAAEGKYSGTRTSGGNRFVLVELDGTIAVTQIDERTALQLRRLKHGSLVEITTKTVTPVQAQRRGRRR
ncbi:TraI/MobA(P) family conjugative relaxase [Variovorax sp. LT1P1]|uniref:TraI/MobA(P) family conjugative relaxase n=1 Tax=Variovorax sp. LT1P1 TaxID=3443730 RepID=UPI003F450EF7